MFLLVEFSQNRNLQNLLILTSIKADKSRVMEYINRLDKYDAVEIADIATGAQLFEEAFACYKKAGLNDQAMGVLLTHIGDLDRAQEFADRLNQAPVHALLAKAQLASGTRTTAAVESFLKADDPSMYRELTIAATKDGLYLPLIKYLRMCRPKIQVILSRYKQNQNVEKLIYVLVFFKKNYNKNNKSHAINIF